MHRVIAVHLVACLMALLVIAAPARGAATEQSLLVEAFVLLGQADAAGDPERESELLLEARERLRRIVSEHAGGKTASELVGAGVEVVGGEPITLDSVERRICEVAPTAMPACDEMAYARATALDTAAAYEEYLSAYPGGRHAEEAKRKRTERAQSTECLASPTVHCVLAWALQTAAGIEDASSRGWPLGEIVAAQAEAGDIAGALQTAQGIEYASCRAWALGEIAAAQAEAGDRTGASETVAEALQMAAMFGDWEECVQALGAIAVAQAKAGDRTGASETIAEALQTAARMWGIGDEHREYRRVRALGAIAAAQAEAGDRTGASETIAEALQIAARMPDPEVRAWLFLGGIAAAQAEAGDRTGASETIAEVLQAAARIEDPELRMLALCKIPAALLAV